MSEGSQKQQRAVRNTARAERTTTSCGECRRRKQKCDQEQPCSNCLRRFPVPLCEYRAGNRIPGTSTFLAPARAGGRVSLHPPIPGVSSPVFQASQSPKMVGHSPISVAGWAVSENTTSQSSSVTDCSTDPSVSDAPWPVSDPLDQSKRAAAAVAAPASWIPLADPQRSRLDSDIAQASRQMLAYRLAVPGLVFDAADRNGHGEHDDDGDDGNNELLFADESIPRDWHEAIKPRVQRPEGPISGVDDQIVHFPVAQTVLNKKLLRIYVTVLSRFKASLDGDPDLNNPFIRYYSPFCLQDPLVVQIILYTSACFLHETGHVRTATLRTLKGCAIHMLNESLRPHGANDGRHQSSRDAAEPPLTTTTTTESGRRSEHPSDAAIAGVIQLTVAEWYWGETEDDLRYHLRGLRGMIRLRGGLDQLGMNGLLAKNAIAHDVSISLAHENIPLLLTPPPSDIGRGGGDDNQGFQSQARRSQGGATVVSATASDPWCSTGYAFVDPIKDVPLRTAHMSPLVSHLPSSVGVLPSFADCAASLGMHPATASILDNVRYLIGAVEAVYAVANETNATATSTVLGMSELTTTTTTTTTTLPTSIQASWKAQLTGRYMHEHISGLHSTIPGFRETSSPDEVPTRTGSSPTSSHYSATAATATAAAAAAAVDEAFVRSGSLSSTGTAGRGSVGAGRSPSEPASNSMTTPEWPQTRDASDSPASPRSMQHGHHRQHLQQSPDFMYQVVRMAAIVYTRAIATGTPLSGACTESEFLHIWTTTWRVPLSAWNGALGVFHWIMLAIAPACHRTPHARFVKNMTTISTLTLGVENWAMAMGAARAAMRLQHWLGSQQGGMGTDKRDGTGAAAAAAGSTAAREAAEAAGSAAGGQRSGLEKR